MSYGDSVASRGAGKVTTVRFKGAKGDFVQLDDQEQGDMGAPCPSWIFTTPAGKSKWLTPQPMAPLFRLPSSGTYKVAYKPCLTARTKPRLTLAKAKFTKMPLNGAATKVRLDGAGSAAVLQFRVRKGQRVTLAELRNTFARNTGVSGWRILVDGPQGPILRIPEQKVMTFMAPTCPAGRYRLSVLQAKSPGRVDLRVSTPFAVPVTLNRPTALDRAQILGRELDLTFTAQAGQRIIDAAPNLWLNHEAPVVVTGPDGSSVERPIAGGWIAPSTGTYHVIAPSVRGRMLAETPTVIDATAPGAIPLQLTGLRSTVVRVTAPRGSTLSLNDSQLPDGAAWGVFGAPEGALRENCVKFCPSVLPSLTNAPGGIRTTQLIGPDLATWMFEVWSNKSGPVTLNFSPPPPG